MGPTSKSMSPLTRETLALRLRQNWLAKHPLDAAVQPQPVDDSLTSLSWLQNLNIMKMASPTPPSSPVSDKQQKVQVAQFSSNAQVNPNAILNMTNLPGGRIKQEPGLVTPTPLRTISGIEISPPHGHGGSSLDKTDYKTNPHIKPPYSYATLICMAMRESSKNKITLAGIYNWITENFMYYRVADPSWQNSIRHNLSLNKCFQKVPRRKDEPGKGGFWRINPEFEDMFVNGIFKKRRCSPISPRDSIIAQPPLKRFKANNEDSNSSMTSLSGLATVTAVQSILTPMNSIEDGPLEPAVIEIKREPRMTASSLFRQMAGPDISESIDFSWNSILNQDIEVGGVKVKTEDLLNEADPVSNSITALSPPPSENSSDISLEDLLNTEFGTEPDEALDFENGDPLDLTVTGVTMKAPQWWEESINGKQSFISPNSHSRMSTPVALDNDLDYAHPWAEDKQNLDPYADSFDKDFSNLFDMLEHTPSADS